MKPSSLGTRAFTRGFTLLEMLVAITVFMILMTFLTFMVTGVQKAWVEGDQKVEIYQGGRAALELFAREVSSAVASDRMQFVQSPDIASKVPNFAVNSPSLFCMTAGQSTSKGNLNGIGYYLSRNAATKSYKLNRFCVRPDNSNGFYLGANDYSLQSIVAKRPWSFANEALWITTLNVAAFNPDDSRTVVSPVADGVVAMWIRCLDKSGNPIPWLSTVPSYDSGTIQFSSGASFQMTTPNSPFTDANTNLSNQEKTFQYTAGPTLTESKTNPANRLPAFVEVTLIMVDSRTLQRHANIPEMPAPTTALDVPNQIQTYQESLIAAGITSARTLTTRIKTVNSAN